MGHPSPVVSSFSLHFRCLLLGDRTFTFLIAVSWLVLIKISRGEDTTCAGGGVLCGSLGHFRSPSITTFIRNCVSTVRKTICIARGDGRRKNSSTSRPARALMQR